MKIRYLHLPNMPPLRDAAITFRREEALGTQPLTLHFLVGLNGTGKTRLLQALAETFIAMEADDLRLPFPVLLVYDRQIDGQDRTILFHHQGGSTTQAALAVFETSIADTDWQALAHAIRLPGSEKQLNLRHCYRGEAVPSGTIATFLPDPLMVYTSGNIAEWSTRFAPRLGNETVIPEEVNADLERPPIWSVANEKASLRDRGLSEEANRLRSALDGELADLFNRAEHSWFLPPAQLKLAVCAVTLDQALREWRKTDRQPPDPNLKRLLEEDVNWRWPLSLTLSIDFQPDQWGQMMKDEALQLQRLIELASAYIREPEPGTGRQLMFDLGETQADRAASLMEILGGEKPTPFDVFRGLRSWQTQGLLRDLSLTFRKHRPKDPADRDVLLYDWLSDGEQMLLGRIALFYLLQGRDDALLILDEPETHFNDAWKRNLADIIEQALMNTHCHVVLTTHASIVVTDAYSDEVILLTRNGQEVNVPLTLASEQGEALRAIFDVDRSTGRRAERRVQAALDDGSIEALESMLDEVGPGHFRFKIVRELQKHVPPDQLA